MITIRLWGRDGRCRQHLAELLASAFEREGCHVRESRRPSPGSVPPPLTLQVDGVKVPEAARGGSGEVAIVLDAAEGADAVTTFAMPC
jgi:hypothetical protein